MTKAPINRVIVQIISVVLLGTSCREVYFPEDFEQTQPILSVHGILYEDSLPVVKLCWTMGYYEETENPVNNATVIVSDNSGRADTLTEIGQKGLYTISGYGFPGTTGMVYTLQIETEDGNIFVSNPVRMPAKPVVENFYAEKTAKDVFIYTANGELTRYTRYGASVYTDLLGESENDNYYRFRTRAVQQTGYARPPGIQEIYYTIINTSDLYDIAKSVPFNNQQVVKRHEDTFLTEPEQIVYDNDYIGYHFFMGYIITHRIYSISADVYDYYESVKEQLTAENEIFAPVPTRIRSNIFCVNNDAARVIGVFEASSTLTLFMKCIIYYGYISSTELQSLPEGCPFFSPPEYPAITQ